MKGLLKMVGRDERGQVLVLVALLAAVLMGFTASVIDIGMVQLAKARLQNAADAAALAGAAALPDAGAAMNTARDFAELNGAERPGTTATCPYEGDANKIEVVCLKNVPYTFARFLGFTAANVSARAVAGKTGPGGPFDYAVFSGDTNYTLEFNGTNMGVVGSVHSNYRLLMNGTNQTIHGSAEAVSTLTMSGTDQTVSGTCQGTQITTSGTNITVGNKIYRAAPRIEIPDFFESIQAEAEAAGQAYAGNKTYGGTNVRVDAPIYVDGKLSVNGTNFSGKGAVLVSGDIEFNGTNLQSMGGSTVCFYAKNGNIIINGTNIDLCGLIYAPRGTITLNGTNLTVRGRVIGNKIKFNGTNITVDTGTGEDLASLPQSGSVKLIE